MILFCNGVTVCGSAEVGGTFEAEIFTVLGCFLELATVVSLPIMGCVFFVGAAVDLPVTVVGGCAVRVPV